MNNPWEGYNAGLELRSYQQQAMDRFKSVRAGKQQHAFYLVAPPGAGKTLLGLLMAEALAHPAVCLSPNAAIQGQWLSRLQEHWVCLDSTLEAFAPHPACAEETQTEPQALISLTYQRISVRTGDGEAHPNVLALRQALREGGVRTVVLDECHHLGNEWGRAVEALCEALGEGLERPFVIGLTATPVLQEEGPLARLLGEVDHAISLPSVVRSGDLATYQDLCHIVSPSAEEEDDLQGNLGRFERLLDRLCASEEGRFGLESWYEMLELSPCSAKDQPYEDLLDMFAAEPELITAWCRLRFGEGREPPAVLPYLPELYEGPTLADRLLLAAEYAARYLCREHLDAPLTVEAIAALEEWGYEVRPGAVRRRFGVVSRALGFSRRKLAAAVEILRTEMRHLGDDLRALVITDYEFPPQGKAGLSCVDVMALLTSIPDVDEIDPILITGKSVLVDDDLWSTFEETYRALCAERSWDLSLDKEQEHGYWRIEGRGTDWRTSTMVALVTHMLEEGVSRCLISTRALLGEGWDCLRLNTLIDLTVVTSGVAVNQIRGRSIRQDPDNQVKVANNWDILCVSSLGDRADLERLESRHEKLYGITDDGQVERGLGHIHPCFNRVSTEELFFEREEINAMMHRRAADRMGARERWRVGQSFADKNYRVLSFTTRPRRDPPVAKGSTQAALVPRTQEQAVVMAPVRYQAARRSLRWTLGAGTLLAGGALAAGLTLWPPLGLLALAPLLATSWRLKALDQQKFTTEAMDAELANIAEVLAQASAAQGGQRSTFEIGRREDGSVRVVWQGVSPEFSERLTYALAELLGPVGRQRYLLVESLRAVESTSLWSRLVQDAKGLERVFVVPRMFARKKDAQIFLAAWQAHRNPAAEVLHRQSEAGQALAEKFMHSRPLGGEAAIRTVWS